MIITKQFTPLEHELLKEILETIKTTVDNQSRDHDNEFKVPMAFTLPDQTRLKELHKKFRIF
jgi:hypothetical protein